MAVTRERICDGVEWGAFTVGRQTILLNPESEAALDESGLGALVRGAKLATLVEDVPGARIGEGSYGTVYEVDGDPNTVIRISSWNIPQEMRVNAALHHALQSTPYSTPQYHAYISAGPHGSITLMSRAAGKTFDEWGYKNPRAHWDEPLRNDYTELQDHLERVGSLALEGVGFDVGCVEWDLHPGNLISVAEPTPLSEAAHLPLTIIDQQYRSVR